MARRKPNGYGCVTRLSGNRSRPWVVKVTIYDADGFGKQVPVGYAATEQEALILLAKYNNNPWEADRESITLADLYRRWAEVKLPKLSKSQQKSLSAAYKHCSKYYGIKYRQMKSYQMQDCIDSCGLSYATEGNIKTLFWHLDRFAFEMDIIDKMYSQLVTVTPVPETTREPFTRKDIDAVWELSGDRWADAVLLFLYTGFRLTELLEMRSAKVNLKDNYFQGGIKSASGKNRIVPIHHRILPIVRKFIDEGNEYLISENEEEISANTFRARWSSVMRKIGTDKTPHEARHTFETMLDNAGGNRKCIDMLMGHKSKDVGNRIYNHKTIEQLRETVELLI